MKAKHFICLGMALLSLGMGVAGCSYHNDDDPNVYPDLKPDPEPTPEPEPEVNKEYAEACQQPNCYMIKPGESVSIPILKAYAVWSLYSQWLGTEDFGSATPEATLLWQDQPDLIRSIGLIPGASAEQSYLTVATAEKVGNAVVAIRIGGKIRWSWHLWVTRYKPDAEPTVYGKLYTWDNNADGQTDYTLMDRNLGATNTEALIADTAADSLAACGLFYQWGRKDPFPGDSKFRYTNETDYSYFESKPIYDINGNLLANHLDKEGEGLSFITTNTDSLHTGLWKSITKPSSFLIGNARGGDWFRDKNVERCDTLWNSGAGKKTPFDPCPKGWRVPANRNNKFVWNNLDGSVTGNYTPVGVIPFNGLRTRYGRGCLKNSGFCAYIWTGNNISSNTSESAYVLNVYISPSEKRPVCKRDINVTSDGCGVRCVREY